ncbi:MAG: hypothetical protein LQ348_005294 [Seirophora lacunosa]|nr:MAG: hypothetical protein LQ348_005294 [Seirophora lacunosa]
MQDLCIARNASASPLLRLPSELRDRIWTYVLGGRLVHLKHDHTAGNPDYLPDQDSEESDDEYAEECRATLDRNPWQHLVCQHDCPEEEPDKKVVLDEEDPEEATWQKPHAECYLDDYDDPYCLRSPRPEDPSGKSAMHLTVLRASRQIYVEANRILWATNTFSFADGPTLKHFMKTRNVYQKRLIHSLRFDMNWICQGEKEWNSALNMATIRSWTGLRALRLRISFDPDQELWGHPVDTFVQDSSETEGLWKLSILPLTSAEVSMHDYPHRDPCLAFGFQAEYWQQSDMDECAEEIRQVLLNPKGAETYAKHQAERISPAARLQERLRTGHIYPYM